jgi:hypothetical protein
MENNTVYPYQDADLNQNDVEENHEPIDKTLDKFKKK